MMLASKALASCSLQYPSFYLVCSCFLLRDYYFWMTRSFGGLFIAVGFWYRIQM